MLPTIQVFGRTIAMYGLMIELGLTAGIAAAVLRSKRRGFMPVDVIFASLFACIGIFIGAKLLYILITIPEFILHYKQFLSHPSLMKQLLIGGFVFYGGLIGAAIGYYIYCRKFHLPFLRMLDLIAPSIPLIHAIGRLGCNFAGCCYGIPYDGPGHVIFNLSPFAPKGMPLFPTQLAESGLNFLAAGALLLYARSPRRQGRIFGVYVFYYAVMRFILEFFRGDIIRGGLLGLSTSQWISLALIPVGIWFIFGIRQRMPQEDIK